MRSRRGPRLAHLPGILLFFLAPSLLSASNEYKIDLTLDPVKGTLHGIEKIVYRNETEAPLNTLFVEAPGRPGDPPLPGNERWRIFALMDSRGNNLQLTWKAEEEAYAVALPSDLGAGFKTNFTVEYERSIDPAENAPGYLDLNDRGAATWYLKFRAYRAGSFGSDDFKDITVSVAPPAGWVTASTGAPPSRGSSGPGQITLSADAVRNFALAFSDKFKEARGSAGTVPVAVYSLEGQDAWARNALSEAIEAVNFFSSFLGAYPPAQVSVLPEAPGRPEGNSSSNVIYVPVTPEADRLREAVSLQAARLVWGWSVGDPSDATPFVGNGLAIWCQQNYLAKRNGTDLHTQFLNEGINDIYLVGVLRGYDTTLLRSRAERAKLDWDFDRIVARAKSAAVIHMLGSITGDEKLQEVLKNILKTGPRQILTDRDFQAFAQTATTAKLDGFFEQWLRSKNTLDYYMTHVRTVKTETGYEVHADVYKTGTGAMPVEISAEDLNGARVRSVFPADRSSGELVIPLKAPLAAISLDPRNFLPLISRVGTLGRLDLAEDLIGEAKLLRAREQIDQALSESPEDPRGLFLKGRVLKEMGSWSGALALWARAISLARNPADSAKIWAQIWTARIYDLQGKRTEAVDLYNAVATLPDSRGSRSAAAEGQEKPFEDSWPPLVP
jgi:hypothetical protein